MNGRTFLHLIHRYYPFRGGSEYYFQALSERFAADGAGVHLFATDAWDLEYLWDPRKRRIEDPETFHNGVQVHRTRTSHLPFSRITHRGIRRVMGELSRVPNPVTKQVLWALSRFGPWLPELSDALDVYGRDADLVHAANIGLESMIADAAAFARRRDIPLLITPKLHLGEGTQSVVRRYYTMPHQLDLLRRADFIMTQTSLEAEFLTSLGIRGEKLRVVGLGIDVESVTGGDAQRFRVSHDIDSPIVASLGAAAFDKGTIHLCQAVIAHNRRGTTPITLVIAGPIMSEFQTYIDSLCDEERSSIQVLGFVDDQTRNDILAAADLLALPSRTEAFGYVFLEAWANGKPVIGARAGGIPAVIDEHVDGLMVDFGDTDSLTAAINMLVSDRKFARQLGEHGRNHKVVDRETWYLSIRSVYEDVLSSGGMVKDANYGTGPISATRT